jgi:hypothetical protein
MGKWVVIACASLMCGCNATSSDVPVPAPALAAQRVDQGTIVKRRQDEWMRCLKETYGESRKKKMEKNAAAELALAACASEEQSLAALSAEAGVPPSSFTHLKAQTKKVLIEQNP